MNPGVTFHAPKNARECEGMNPHARKWAPTLGIGIPMDFRIFKGQLQGSKFIGLKYSLYHWKALGTQISKMVSDHPFRYLKYKLWPKEGSGVKLIVWLPTTKNQELPQFPCVQVACDIPLESFQRGLQLCFRLHLHQRFIHKVMGPQIRGSPNFENFGIPTWESQNKMSLECWPCGHTQSILYGGRWWLPPSLGRGESCEFEFARGSFVHQKCSSYALTNLLFGLYKSMWMIEVLVNFPNPILEL
jgi:hypothetical protein